MRTQKVASYTLPRGAPQISSLGFMDDLLLFTRATRRSVETLFGFLKSYEKGTGQQISRSKSSFVISKTCMSAHIRFLSTITGIKVSSLPFKYFGCMLYQGRKRKVFFQHIADSVTRKLNGWVGRIMSPGGRLILIRHVLAAISLHVLASMEPPKGILDQLENLFSKFLWAYVEERSRKIWRSWSRVVFPVLENRLGV